jgi:hypothetical protein
MSLLILFARAAQTVSPGGGVGGETTIHTDRRSNTVRQG